MRTDVVLLLTCATVLGASLISPPISGRQGQPAPTTAQIQTPAGGERRAGPAVTFQVPPMPDLPNTGLGETDQPLIPGQPWKIRDLNRPKPVTVTAGKHAGDPPSDALVLFDGTDLSHWTVSAGGPRGAQAPVPAGASVPNWKVESGYMEVTPGGGSLTSKDRFKDFQLHLECASPVVPLGISQYRGNSGVTIGGREIQILDNYHNATYSDGYVAAIYNQWPPLANPSRPPGEWQTLDIAYMAARYDGDRLIRNPFITVFLNGVMVHNNREIQQAGARGGARAGTAAAGVAAGAPGQAPLAARGPTVPPGGDQPIGLMGHPSAIPGNAVRYRNIWARKVDVEMPTQSAPGGGQ